MTSIDPEEDAAAPEEVAQNAPPSNPSRRPAPWAFVILGVLSLLAAGGVILGVVQSPTTTDLAVHNGAGETLAASQVVGHFTASYLGTDVVSFNFAGNKAVEVARAANGAVKGKRTVTGTSAKSLLQPIKLLLAIRQFTQHGSLFVSTEPAGDLVPAYERSLLKGTYRSTVQLAGGYVVGVRLAINALERGQKVTETVDYHLTRVGSWEAS